MSFVCIPTVKAWLTIFSVSESERVLRVRDGIGAAYAVDN